MHACNARTHLALARARVRLGALATNGQTLRTHQTSFSHDTATTLPAQPTARFAHASAVTFPHHDVAAAAVALDVLQPLDGLCHQAALQAT